MIPRVAGAALGLLAFSIAIFAGLWINNPVEITLSRALWALIVFCVIGLVVGAVAQSSVNEHMRSQRDKRLAEVAATATGVGVAEIDGDTSSETETPAG